MALKGQYCLPFFFFFMATISATFVMLHYLIYYYVMGQVLCNIGHTILLYFYYTYGEYNCRNVARTQFTQSHIYINKIVELDSE